MRIGSADDAKSVVRKYIIGTRSRHRKIASVTIDEEVKGPDDKGTWTMNGTYATEDGGKEQFTASVTSKGEVRMTNVKSADVSGKRQPTFSRR